MEKKELINGIVEFGVSRGLHEGDPEIQLNKFFEEMGELSAGLLKKNHELIKDSIGDAIVVLSNLIPRLDKDVSIEAILENFIDSYRLKKPRVADIYKAAIDMVDSVSDENIFAQTRIIAENLQAIAGENGLDNEVCMQFAYNEIKDRKGKLINGNFVKEEDLKEAEPVRGK